MRSICILGKCSNTRRDAPINDPKWEVWTLAWDLVPVVHRTFEIHAFWRNFRGNPEDAEAHIRWLMGCTVPVYMRQVEPDVPCSVAYPFDEVEKIIGKGANGGPYIESSIAAMFAVALLELQPGDRIGIWGVDMGTTTEYAYQRPNMEYLIGFARGRGIKVFIPPQSALLSSAHDLPYGIWESEEAKSAT